MQFHSLGWTLLRTLVYQQERGTSSMVSLALSISKTHNGQAKPRRRAVAKQTQHSAREHKIRIHHQALRRLERLVSDEPEDKPRARAKAQTAPGQGSTRPGRGAHEPEMPPPYLPSPWLLSKLRYENEGAALTVEFRRNGPAA